MKNHRSQNNVRSIFARTGFCLLILLLVLPRFTVHSHASLSQSGIGSAAFLRHVQLVHTALGREIPADKLHVHCCFGNCDLSLPSTNEQSAATASSVVPHDLSCLNDALNDALVVALVDTPNRVLFTVSCQHSETYSPDLRICYCVWTC